MQAFYIKPYYRKRISGVLYYLAGILIVGGLLLLIPFLVGLLYGEMNTIGLLLKAFIVPGALSVIGGLLLRRLTSLNTIFLKDAMITCSLAWLLLTLIGAVPYYVMLPGVSYLDGCFETMSGYTTTGITVLTGIDSMARSILFWRALSQWIGGLGILSMFILIGFKGGAAANKLFLAEGHKITSQKPAPGVYNATKVLWMIYGGYTAAQIVILMLLGVGFFDAITHAFTTISTGGYSIYDNSIAQYAIDGYANAHIIEMVYMLFMVVGGINFFLHFRLMCGEKKALWDNAEIRYLWLIIAGGTLLIMLSNMFSTGTADYSGLHGFASGWKALALHGKDIMFQVISILTTTGFATRDINSPYFTAFAKQLFLVMMVIGGCAGSTGGGVKIIRIVILGRLVRNRLYQINTSRLARVPLTIDNHIIEQHEIHRIVVIFFMWMVLLVLGGAITAFFSDLSAWQAYSGMFSALGNIGPSYISIPDMIAIHPAVKLTYIFGMLAGRLEIIPILLIFNRKFYS